MLALVNTKKGRSGSFHGGRNSLGKGPATKSDEFLEKCQGGGVIFTVNTAYTVDIVDTVDTVKGVDTVESVTLLTLLTLFA